MDIETGQLALLEALGDGLTMTQAAKRLFVSQPALSQRLATLEHRVGRPLFLRAAHTLTPTPAGRRLVAAARVALGELRAAGEDLARLEAAAPPTVRFTSQCSSHFEWLPEALRAFLGAFPDAEVRHEAVPDDRPVPALLEDRVDVALVTKSDPAQERVATRPLFQDELIAVFAGDHAFAGRGWLEARHFSDVHLIVYDGYDPARVPHVPLPLPEGARPRRVSAMPLVTELIAQLVAASDRVAVLPRRAAEPYLALYGLATARLTRRGLVRAWSVATRRGPLPPHVEAFVDALLAAGQRAEVAPRGARRAPGPRRR